MKKGILTTIALLVGLIFTGCGQKEETTLKQEIKIAIGSDIKTLDVSRATDGTADITLAQIMEGLTRTRNKVDGTDEIIPALAKDWSVSEDGLVWTFNLRDANWSDGKPVTAEDFKYSWLRTLDPKTASGYSFLLFPIKNAKEYNEGKVVKESVGIETVGDKVLKVTLEAPTPFFVEMTHYKTTYPQRKDIVEKYGKKYGTSAQTVISNGPYLLKEWKPNSGVVFVKNDTYWDKDNVALNKIEMSIVREKTTLYSMLYTGQIDLAYVESPEWNKKLSASKDFNRLTGFAGNTTFLILNERDNLFKNKKIRKAFNLAIDREKYTKVVFNTEAQPAYGFVPPQLTVGGVEFRKNIEEPLKSSTEDPKELLKEGLKELGIDTPLDKLVITFDSYENNESGKASFALLQEMWKEKLGVLVQGNFADYPVVSGRISKGEYQIALSAWRGDYNDPTTFTDLFTTGNMMYNTGYSNPDYDNYVKQASQSGDQKFRMEVLGKAEKVMLEDAAIIPLVYTKRNIFYTKKLEGFYKGIFGAYTYRFAKKVK